MLSEIIDRWYSTAKRMLFKYNEGFFELPLVLNSPETIIKSAAKMPFVYHKPKKSIFGTDNPFLKSEIHYHKICKGLWYMHSNALYKENVNYININSKKLESDYYLLYLEMSETKSNTKNGLLNGVSYLSHSWVLTKPTAANTHCQFKENRTISLVLYFNEHWLQNTFLKHELVKESVFKHFFESKAKMIIGTESESVANHLISHSESMFKKKLESKTSDEEWLQFAFEYLACFIRRYDQDNLNENLLLLEHVDRTMILKVEKILLDHVLGGFPGIDKIAFEVGLSKSKLKDNFKLVFGDTIFQYFRKKQLESARELILTNKLTIKKVAELYGYSNPSKFTAAYKDYFGLLPSEENLDKEIPIVLVCNEDIREPRLHHDTFFIRSP